MCFSGASIVFPTPVLSTKVYKTRRMDGFQQQNYEKLS